MTTKTIQGGDFTLESTKVVYAPYLEKAHHALLNGGDSAVVINTLSAIGAVNLVFDKAPLETEFGSFQAEQIFTGKQDVKTFPALFDTFGSLMASKDIEIPYARWSEKCLETVIGVVSASTYGIYLEDNIANEDLDKLGSFARLNNIVSSSAFIVQKAIIESTRLRRCSDILTEIQLTQLETARVLEKGMQLWNTEICLAFGEITRDYISARSSEVETVYQRLTQIREWNLRVLDSIRPLLPPDGAGVAQQWWAATTQAEILQGIRYIGSIYMGQVFGVVGGTVGAIVGGWLGSATLGYYVGYACGSWLGTWLGSQIGSTYQRIEDRYGSGAATLYDLSTGGSVLQSEIIGTVWGWGKSAEEDIGRFFSFSWW